MSSRVSWTEEQDDYVVEQYKAGVTARQIAEGLAKKFDIERDAQTIHSRMTKLRQDGRIPETARSKKMREIMLARYAAEKEGNPTKGKTRKQVAAEREAWSDDESERMWQLIASGATPEVTAVQISKEFGTKRTAKKVVSRLNWLKAKAAGKKGNGKSPKSAIMLAKQDPKAQIEPVQLALPLAEERHVRIDFPRGAIALSVSGDVPDNVKHAINEMLWA